RPFREPYLVTRADFRRNGRELACQIFDSSVAQQGFQPGAQPRAGNEASTGQIEIEKVPDAARRQLTGKVLDVIEPASCVAAADNGSNRCSGNNVRFDAGRAKGPDHPDMRPAARGTTTKGQADLAVLHQTSPAVRAALVIRTSDRLAA